MGCRTTGNTLLHRGREDNAPKHNCSHLIATSWYNESHTLVTDPPPGIIYFRKVKFEIVLSEKEFSEFSNSDSDSSRKTFGLILVILQSSTSGTLLKNYSFIIYSHLPTYGTPDLWDIF